MRMILIVLAGCGGRIERQAQYIRVEVPVQVPCRAPGVEGPPWASADLRKTDSLEVKVRALLAERRQWIAFTKLLKAAITGCR